jgi:hypothetical protein
MAKDLKFELQALRVAQKVDDATFTHMFGGVGYVYFTSDDLEHPILVLNLADGANTLIYNAVKSHPLEFYYKSYAGKYGKDVVPKELIEYAYYQCKIDDKSRLVFQLDFSKDSLMRKYLGKPEVRVIDDFIFKSDKQISPLLPAFFHLFNTRLKDEKWAVLAISMQYAKDDSKITFDEFKDILKELDILS